MPRIDVPGSEAEQAAIAASDLECVLAGRCPFTLQKVPSQTLSDYPISAAVRAERLFSLYTNSIYCPYICFRVAFAIALATAEDRPSLACDFLFEGLFVFLRVAPKMCRLPAVRSGLILFAELLDRVDKYFYAAQVFDAHYLTNPTDFSSSGTIAQMSQRRRDIVRAVFHFGHRLRGFLANDDRAGEALYVCQMMVSLIAEHGHVQDAVEILTGMLSRTFRLPMCPSAEPRRKRSASVQFQLSANSVVAGIMLAHFLVKQQYFHIAETLLDTLSTTAGATLSCVIQCLRAKLFLASNRFEQFRRELPALDLRTVQSLSGFRALASGTVSFDATFTALKLLAKGHLERGQWAHALFWSEAMLHAIPSLSYRSIGAAHLLRGRALAAGCWQNWGRDGDVSLEAARGPAMAAVASYARRAALPRAQLVAEALASLRTARVCQERIGGVYAHMQASAALADLAMHYFADEGPLAALTVGEPVLVTEVAGGAGHRVSAHREVTVLTQATVSGFLAGVIGGLSQNAAKSMYPPIVVEAQLLAARARFLAGDADGARQAADFAFENLQRYFFAANEFVARDARLGLLATVRGIVASLCYCLLAFDPERLNARLVVFDWLAELDALVADRLRSVTDDNRTPIDATCDVKLATLRHLSNRQFPDFFRSVAARPRTDDAPPPAAAALLALARANMRLCELQRLDEAAMTAANRALCLQVEAAADRVRALRRPVPTGYAGVTQVAAMAKGAIFVQRLFHSIFVYVPRTRELRQLRLRHGGEQRFLLAANRAEQPFTTTSSLFDAEFYAFVGMLLLCDKKQRHAGFERAAALAACARARAQLFDDIGRGFDPWPVIPDDALFGERRIRGALFSVQTSPDPIVFVTSGDLRGLPFEFMFPDQLVLRCLSFVQLARRPEGRRTAKLEATVCRWRDDRDRLMASAVLRSFEAIETLLQACGSAKNAVPYVDGIERRVCFPFPLFSSNAENQAYTARFPFVEVVDVSPETFPDRDSGLYVFTYSDFCELPALVGALIQEFPFAHYMFIPAQFVREAFALMVQIFERQEKRRVFAGKPEICEMEQGAWHLVVSSVAFDFVTLVQGTLMRTLGCPIAVVAPGV
jgi:hypothetical protein